MTPTHKINVTHEIAQASIEVQLDNGVFETTAKVGMELSPRPQLVLEVEFSSADYAPANEIKQKGEITFRLGNGISVEAIVGDRWLIGGGKVTNVLIPKTDRVTVLNDNTPLVSGRFSLINFPSMWDQADFQGHAANEESSVTVIQRTELAAGPWSVEMVADDSLMGIHHSLTRLGGSAITHEAKITRTDGRHFEVEDLDDLLEVLHLFLSFARGSYCGLNHFCAEDDSGSRVYEQWGTRKVEPWRRELRSWVDESSRQTLVPAFDGFWTLMQRPGERDVITKALNWYLRSNESSESEVSLVLTQAALERLSNHAIPSSMQITGAGRRIDYALGQMGIGSAIPSECVELNLLKQQRGWSHGPHALVEIRNDLVHPTIRSGPISGIALAEARDLGLHYVELMLLQLAGYEGKYVNRLKPTDTRVEYVPWASVPTT